MGRGRPIIVGRDIETLAKQAYFDDMEKVSELIHRLGISRSTFFRLKKKWKTEKLYVSLQDLSSFSRSHFEPFLVETQNSLAVEFFMSRTISSWWSLITIWTTNILRCVSATRYYSLGWVLKFYGAHSLERDLNWSKPSHSVSVRNSCSSHLCNEAHQCGQMNPKN